MPFFFTTFRISTKSKGASVATPSEADFRREVRRQIKEERWCKPQYRQLPHCRTMLEEDVIIKFDTYNALQTKIAAERRAIVDQRRAERGFGPLIYGYTAKSAGRC